MVLTEPEGLLRIAMADLETAEASSDPNVFREGAWGFWLHLGSDAPLTHDLRRLLLLLSAEGGNTADLEALAQLTVYAVQFRYDADPTPLGLDRELFNQQVRGLLARVQQLVLPGSDTEP